MGKTTTKSGKKDKKRKVSRGVGKAKATVTKLTSRKSKGRKKIVETIKLVILRH